MFTGVDIDGLDVRFLAKQQFAHPRRNSSCKSRCAHQRTALAALPARIALNGE
jgi:hypothetical protein